MTFAFTGVERLTVEVDGTFDARALALPPGLSHDGPDGCGRVSLFAFDVANLRLTRLPLLRWSYAELLWRVAVRAGDRPAWWVLACDLGARGPRLAARRYVRYPTRAQQVDLTDRRIRSGGSAGTLAITFDDALRDPPDPEPPRALLVGDDAGWAVPWGDDSRAERRACGLSIEEDSLSPNTIGSPINWGDIAVIRRGRWHRCGVAHRRDRATNEP
jgi:hypothetical protein